MSSPAAVARQQVNTHAVRVVPVVFVPGVMGTRLHFTNIDEYWDPDSTWRMLHWVRISSETARREMHFSQPAEVLTESDQLTADQRRRGWAGMVTDFYVPFLRQLERATFPCATVHVWAVGYDWRQGNRTSGTALSVAAQGILQQEQAEELAMISHSMGGLVSRAALKDDAGLASKLLGVIHVFQPAQGAVVFYRRMYTGAIPGIDGEKGLVKIMGDTASKFATLLSALRGPTELIPNNDYRDTGKDWLLGPPPSAPVPYTGNMFDHYRASTAPPGIGWSIRGTPATQLTTRMNESERFHAWLGAFKHPKTWTVYSTGLETDVAVRFNAATHDSLQQQRRAAGDGTVPASSAGSLFTAAETSRDVTGKVFLTDATKRQCEVSGVEHAAAFNDTRVRTVVQQMLLVVLGCVVPPSPQPPPPPPPPTQPKVAENYVIARGDSLDRIARRYGMTWQQLYAYTGDTKIPNSQRLRSGNPNLIHQGEVILVPAKP